MKFDQLFPRDYTRLKPFFKNLRYEHCEYCLPTFLVWNTEEFHPYGAIEGDTLFIAAEYPYSPASRHLTLPVSPTREYSPAELNSLAERLGFERFWFVPGSYLDHYGRDLVEHYFTINKLEDYSDYIYRTEDLIKLAGNKYSKKRNLIRQFNREYLETGRTTIEALSRSNSGDCINYLEEWCRKRKCEEQADDDMVCEKEAAIELINNIELFDSQGLMVRIDGIVAAFGIVSPLSEDMAVLQFEKAFEHVKGLYQFLDNECCKRLCSGYTYINKESDMNIPGLIQSKRSYHPSGYIHAYELALRNHT